MRFHLNCGCVNTTVWMQHMDANKTREKKLDGNYTRILQAISNKSWKQHTTKKKQIYIYLPTISKTIQVRQIRHAVHCQRNKSKLISDILLWTPIHRRACVG